MRAHHLSFSLSRSQRKRGLQEPDAHWLSLGTGFANEVFFKKKEKNAREKMEKLCYYRYIEIHKSQKTYRYTRFMYLHL